VRVYKSREKLATPFFGDARFPVAFQFVNSMKLSGFGDYEQYARWSELPAECFNNRGKFNIDGRRINNSRVTSGRDAFARPLSSAWKKPRVEARLRSFGEFSLALETLSLQSFIKNLFDASNITVIYRLIPPLICTFHRPSFSFIASSVINCRRLHFLISFWNTNVTLLIYIIISLTWMKLDWTFMIELKQRIIKDNRDIDMNMEYL